MVTIDGIDTMLNCRLPLLYGILCYVDVSRSIRRCYNVLADLSLPPDHWDEYLVR